MNRGTTVHLRSKWLKTKAILHDPFVRGLVPDTRRLTRESLGAMLNRYRMIYVKPSSGTFGQGVMRVERAGGVYAYQSGERKRAFRSLGALHASIRRRQRGRAYLAQRGIRLLKYKGRRFDIRVMAQRNPRTRAWEATGIIGRLAHPRRVVTNYHNGGTPMSVRTLLSPHATAGRIARVERRLSLIGRRAAAALSRSYPRVNMVGADIGLEAGFRPWIIELNTMPDPYLFRHLKDKRVHRKVLRYARELGRIKSVPRSKRPRNNRKRR